MPEEIAVDVLVIVDKRKYYKNITTILSLCYTDLILLFFLENCCTINIKDDILSKYKEDI